ncbi:L-ribulokinase [Beutenbergia cavernae DSM 12333]|uniref:Ribulokinase n=1 Tax=Beutenbergia cavernae (strain ATCC BAA-8 / DSM 12333 / CCUG 43141 / JCM 11478 / NBRC 16432 / NCIMB 13614 / HKI 0122) TaxID=471853 RepID=C5C1A7_BEUC1|nr:ribulokinase [Beutenbergia cavernae]ACQ81517.1 L-ribulokinase [Beutenbergia cavernae DSM 12333]
MTSSEHRAPDPATPAASDRSPGTPAPSRAPDETYVVGVDFGTLSGRAVVVRVRDGAELATAVHEYAHAVLDRALPDGTPLPPEWALQVPGDYIDVLKQAVPAAVSAAGIDPSAVVGIGTDFTACTMVPTLADGTPLSDVHPDRPHAYVKLWKHHAAQGQADRINDLARERGESWLARYGGAISSEWQFAKGLQLLEEDPELYAEMTHFVEAADWIVWQLSGSRDRNACTAGYKGILQDGHYPDPEFLAALNPGFPGFVTDKLAGEIIPLGARAGGLTAEAAAWTGLPEGIAVAAGNVDAHVTVPAADALEPGLMTMIMGTSTCHMTNAPQVHAVQGMCGVVDGGIVDGLFGYEAGQSGVGDIFAWYTATHVPAEVAEEATARGVSVHDVLTERAAAQEIGEHGLVALDWHSGNRSVLVDGNLSGVVVGQTLATRPDETYRALLEATAFGTRVIIEAFAEAGVGVTELVVAGGLLKNAFLMQMYSDVTGLPLSTITSEQGPALGSAIHAAVAAGAYPDVAAAGGAMGGRTRDAYLPDAEATARYDVLFAEYRRLHDYFGRGENDVMHRLKAIRRDAHEARVASAQGGSAPADAAVEAAR